LIELIDVRITGRGNQRNVARLRGPGYDAYVSDAFRPGAGLSLTLMLLAGGFLQGANLENAALPFSESIETVLPYLRGRSLAGLLLTVSHFIFAYHFGLMLLGLGRTSTVPTFLNPVEAEISGGH